MPAKIPSDFIRQIIAQTDIVDVISRFVTLKKQGQNHMACCPFHDEKTPSFSVNARKQLYHCFGCHVGGDVINFLQNYENITFVEAIEALSEIQGVQVPYETDEVSDKVDYQALYQIMTQAQRLYQWALRHDSACQTAIDYLKQRHIDGKTAQRYGIGFAPNQWRFVTSFLKTRFSTALLKQAGVTTGEADQGYDRFRNRLMFPIRNHYGQVIGFGGRLVEQDQTNQPKYLNSPETPLFHKGQQLYGLYELKQHQKRHFDHLLVVEGYMDVVRLAQAGYTTAVATLGTAMGASQSKLLYRYTDCVVLCFDGDQAGKQAAMRAAKVLLNTLSARQQAKVLLLPDALDPDAYVTEYGCHALEHAIDQAPDLLSFLLSETISQLDDTNPNYVAQALERAKQLLNDQPMNSYVLSYIASLSKKLNLQPRQVQKAIYGGKKQVETKRNNAENKPMRIQPINPNGLSYIERAMHYMFHDPATVAIQLPEKMTFDIEHIVEQCQHLSGKYQLFGQLLNYIIHEQDLTSASLVRLMQQHYPEQAEYFESLAQNAFIMDSMQHMPTFQILEEIQATIESIRRKHAEQKLKYLIEKAETIGLTKIEKQQMQKILCETKKH